VGNALSWPSFVDVSAPDSGTAGTGIDPPVVAKVESFDGFTYTLRIGLKAVTNDNHHLQVTVAGSFPKERAAVADEKPEDKDRLDKEFKEKTAKLEEKLKKEKAFDGWTYLVSKWTVDTLLKDRKDFLEEKKPEADAAAKPAGEPGEAQPGPLPPPPPVPDPTAPNP
jgi:hypothetical protein